MYNPNLYLLFEAFPTGHFQWANLYNRYQVLSSQMTIKVSSTDAILISDFRAVIFAHPYTSQLPTGASSVDDFVGQPFCTKTVQCGPVSGVSQAILRGPRVRASEILAIPQSTVRNQHDLSGYCTDPVFQPNSQWFYTVVVSNNASVTNQSVFNVSVHIDYEVSYYQPKLMSLHYHSVVGVQPPGETSDKDPCACSLAEEQEQKLPEPPVLVRT